MDFSGKVIAVTGGGNGIGRDTATVLATRGAKVAIGDIDGASAEHTAQALRGSGGEAVARQLDVSDEGSVRAYIDGVVEHFGKLDGAFNCAGIPNSRRLIHELSWEQWSKVIAIDLSGVFLCMKHELRIMLEYGVGAIVNASSGAGVVGVPYCGEYVAAKHGVIGLTKSAALDYATSGIRVNAVLPGLIDTERVQASYVARQADRDLGAWMLAHHAMKRRGTGQEVAQAVAWLLSDLASFVTGVSLPVDGGYLAS